ncbi:MAG: hypothetical protein KKE71_06670 [Nanoarchaeota archaeon]|nr:hypothetical protein [Nanoarchaeota archaeon]
MNITEKIMENLVGSQCASPSLFVIFYFLTLFFAGLWWISFKKRREAEKRLKELEKEAQ